MAEAPQNLWRKKDITVFTGTTSTSDLLADEDPQSIENELEIRRLVYQKPGNTWIVPQAPSTYLFAAFILTASRALNLLRLPRKLENYQLPFLEDEPHFFYDPDEILSVHLTPFAPGNKEINEFKSQLVFELDSETVEDGVVHTVEVAIQRALIRYPQDAPTWIKELFDEILAQEKLSYASGLLQCLGRLRPEGIINIAKSLVIKGLGHENIELREAAITVIEQWGGEDMLEILRQHQEQVPWLANYAQKVIQDFSESR